MKKVKWRWDMGCYMSFCPYCDEPTYEKDHCVFCNKPYEWEEPRVKPTEIQVGEYTIVQCTNKHIHIYENKSGRMIYHGQCTKKKTEDELRQMVEDLPKLWKATEKILKEKDDE